MQEKPACAAPFPIPAAPQIVMPAGRSDLSVGKADPSAPKGLPGTETNREMGRLVRINDNGLKRTVFWT